MVLALYQEQKPTTHVKRSMKCIITLVDKNLLYLEGT